MPIYIRITVNKQRVEFGLQKSIEDNQWHAEKGYAIGSSKSARELNSYLDFVKSKMLVTKRELEEMGKPTTATTLKNKYLGIEDSGKTILEIFSEHNERC